MVECAVCKSREAVQKHHLSYKPVEMQIDICVPCHLRLHAHGVGPNRGKRPKSEAIPEPEPEPTPIGPRFTMMTDEGGIGRDLIRGLDGEVLSILKCPNGCAGTTWFLLGSPSTRTIFLRCPDCGYDTKISGELT